MFTYVSREEIVEANKRIVENSGDPFGIMSEGNLDFVVESMRYRFNRRDNFSSLLLKASIILDLLANKAHVFIEGNKRTAVVVCTAFLELNDYSMEARENDYEFLLSIARNEQTILSISKWLKERIIRRKS